MVSKSLKNYRAKKKRDGICRDCTKPAIRGIFCEEHREKYNNETQRLRNTRRRQKVCLRCGSALHPSSKTYCARHLIEHQERHQADDVVLRGGMSILIRSKKRRVLKARVAAARKTIAKHSKKFSSMLYSTNEKRVFELRIVQGASTLRELGDDLGLSFERIRQIEDEVAIRLADYLKQKGVKL